MTVMAVFLENEHLYPRRDQIYNQFPMLSCAQNIICILVVSKYSTFNSRCAVFLETQKKILIIFNSSDFAQC